MYTMFIECNLKYNFMALVFKEVAAVKTIGMLGGMSWESTLSYYRIINEGIKESLGGLHSAKIVLYSVDFAEIEALQHQGDWEKTAEILGGAAQSVERAGADFLIICTNTMHKVFPVVEKAVGIPIIHIADATAHVLQKNYIHRAGLLGTRFTMEQPFYRGRLEENFNIEVLVPDEAGRSVVHEIIYRELCTGQINQDSKERFLSIIEGLRDQGAEAVILGCTEIALLVQQSDTDVLLYDTTALHAAKAVELALWEA